jgi:hypothetical protein
VWRDLRQHEGIGSGCEVNRVVNGFCGERLPSIDFAHVDLAERKQPQSNMTAMSAEGSTVCALIPVRTNSFASRGLKLVVGELVGF